MPSLLWPAALLLALLLPIAAFDGLYYHLWRFQLHARPESRPEHLIHTARALLGIPIIWLLFVTSSRGPTLFVVLGLLGVDLVVELFDMLVEKDSRAALGGLPRGEYIIHVFATTLRVGAITLAFASHPAADWTLGGAWLHVEPLPTAVRQLTLGAVPVGALVALLHVFLYFVPLRRRGGVQASA